MSVYPRTEFIDSKDAQKYPYIFDCDDPHCYYIVSTKTEEQAGQVAIEHWERTCPMTGNTDATLMQEADERGQRYTKPGLGRSILEKLWEQADADFDRAWELRGGLADTPEAAKVFGICRGLAIAIHMMASPHYASVDDVVREIVRRNKQASGEVEWQPTPGYQYNPLPASKAPVRAKPTPAPAPKAETKSVFTDEQLDGIKLALKNGFEPAMLAQAYKVSVIHINEVKASLDLT